MRVAPRTLMVQGADVLDRTQDRAVCSACGEASVVCDMYYLAHFEWRLVRDNRHLWKIDENGLLLRCRWCKGVQANYDRLRRRHMCFFLTPNAAGDTRRPETSTHAGVCLAHTERDIAGVCSGSEHDPVQHDVHEEVCVDATEPAP